MDIPRTIYVMGVSGSGKSTVGNLLAKRLGYLFFDGDEYHSEHNINKMSRGEALNDDDRKDWLQTLNKLAKNNQRDGAVIVCSALKEKYRNELQKNLDEGCEFLYLKGTIREIYKRLSNRKGHFMPKELLQSQFDSLEEPSNAICLSILDTPEGMVTEFIKRVSH